MTVGTVTVKVKKHIERRQEHEVRKYRFVLVSSTIQKSTVSVYERGQFLIIGAALP